MIGCSPVGESTTAVSSKTSDVWAVKLLGAGPRGPDGGGPGTGDGGVPRLPRTRRRRRSPSPMPASLEHFGGGGLPMPAEPGRGAGQRTAGQFGDPAAGGECRERGAAEVGRAQRTDVEPQIGGCVGGRTR
jgi:hypothetical protein